MQVFFPTCWNNKTLDSPDHRSHMAYPSVYNGGDCPPTHPVRLPAIFFEAGYLIDKFPHGQGTQPFVLSSGDPTGYGFHGDFVSLLKHQNSLDKYHIKKKPCQVSERNDHV